MPIARQARPRRNETSGCEESLSRAPQRTSARHGLTARGPRKCGV